jgi:type II secretory ATPase GspE/PulE/Tfp pilus assembly ATPase PilB-like protein
MPVSDPKKFPPLESVNLLPRSGRVIEPSDKSLGLEPDTRRQLAIWLLPHPGRGADTSKGKVWIVGVPDFMNDPKRYLSLVNRLRSTKYEVEKSFTANEGLIQAIYERQVGEKRNDERWRNTDVNSYLNDIVTQALLEKVSDIHIERREGISNIRWRRHGHMEHFVKEIGTDFVSRLCRAVYDVEAEEEGKETSFREDRLQKATVSLRINGDEIKLRFQSLRAYPGGYDVVLRVLRVGKEDETSYTELEELGYSPDQVKMLQEIVAHPIGALVVSGVTGSGKSTTLKNLVMWIIETRKERCKVYTIEDPPEYRIAGATQMPVGEADETAAVHISPFIAPLKAAMRGDPDVIMIGEIRDEDTADGMQKATQSGHQVLTTVHAPSAMGSVDRLINLGIDRHTMGSQNFITGLVYQRLLPRLCPNCSVPFTDSLESGAAPAAVIELGRRMETVLRPAMGDNYLEPIRVQGTGCSTCRDTGIVDRTVCAEIVIPDLRMLRLFGAGRMIDAYEYWRSKSDNSPISDRMEGKTALEHAIYKMANGLVSPYDVESMIGRVDSANKELQEMIEAAEENSSYQRRRHEPALPDDDEAPSAYGRRPTGGRPSWQAST